MKCGRKGSKRKRDVEGISASTTCSSGYNDCDVNRAHEHVPPKNGRTRLNALLTKRRVKSQNAILRELIKLSPDTIVRSICTTTLKNAR